MTNYIEFANLGGIAQDAIREFRSRGGQVPVTRLGRPTGAYLTVATPDASVALPEAAKLAARLLGAFEDTRPDDMTDVFYIHAYNELALVLRDLLNALGTAERIGGY
ncbi:hypothetical protein [Isoptericola sp. NPDC019571]|uniref:hypothetical protein n=1 Tax=Isoptericola sp. NPDC019571 TaxID=3364008 RepID=UPI0037A717CA